MLLIIYNLTYGALMSSFNHQLKGIKHFKNGAKNVSLNLIPG